MGHGLSKAYSFTMSAAVGSASVLLGRSFAKVYLQIPTMASASALDVYASPDGTQTYYQLRHSPIASTTTQTWSYTIAQSAPVNGALVPIPGGFQAYKIVAESIPAAALGFQVICGDD